jgi:hypothetical protein
MTVPDTIDGAVILSVIDFILSLLFISAIGVLLHFLPVINRFGEVDEDLSE